MVEQTNNADPKGWAFYDKATKRNMKLVYEGPWKDWLLYKHPDGQWVSMRKATPDDWNQIAKAASATIHG